MRWPRPWWKQLRGSRSELRDRRIFLVMASVLVATGMQLVSHTVPFRLAELRVYDVLSTILPPSPNNESPVVVAIDEPSMAEIGQQWPWPRGLHADLIEALRKAGAKTIGFDIVFAEPSPVPGADARLAAALDPDVVLAADETLIETPQADQLIRVEPVPELAQNARTGLVAISLDQDGTLRRIPAYEDGFAATLLRHAGREAVVPPPGALLQAFGSARTFTTISYYQALDPDNFLPDGFLDDRAVIVGLSMQTAPTVSAGGPDAYSTSFTVRSGRLTSGPEIQAMIYDNLARSLYATPVAELGRLLALLASVAAAALGTRRSTGWSTGLLALAAAIAWIAISLVLLREIHVFLAPIAPALGFIAVTALQSMRDYAVERRMRKGITRAFSQYLSPVMVERLANDPSLLKLGGETRTLTILFADIRGFTTIAESMKDDPERLTHLINRLLSPMSTAVLDAGGTIDKYIGDCIMAFWNAPLDDPDHAVHAVQAGLRMLAAVDEVNAELAAEGQETDGAPVKLRLGVGINTGTCVVGNMGSDQRFDYSALGDPVNLASRLESETKNLGVSILLGPETARLVSIHMPLRALGTVQVKGKQEAIPVATVEPVALPETSPATINANTVTPLPAPGANAA